MDCSQCKKKCCNRDLCLTLDEYQYFRQLKPELKDSNFSNYGKVFFLNIEGNRGIGICPFFDEGKCSIYNNRPLVCKRFPLYFIPKGFMNYTVIHPDCSLSNIPINEMLTNGVQKYFSKDDIDFMFQADYLYEAKMLITTDYLKKEDLIRFLTDSMNRDNQKSCKLPYFLRFNLMEYTNNIQLKLIRFKESEKGKQFIELLKK